MFKMLYFFIFIVTISQIFARSLNTDIPTEQLVKKISGGVSVVELIEQMSRNKEPQNSVMESLSNQWLPESVDTINQDILKIETIRPNELGMNIGVRKRRTPTDKQKIEITNMGERYLQGPGSIPKIQKDEKKSPGAAHLTHKGKKRGVGRPVMVDVTIKTTKTTAGTTTATTITTTAAAAANTTTAAATTK